MRGGGGALPLTTKHSPPRRDRHSLLDVRLGRELRGLWPSPRSVYGVCAWCVCMGGPAVHQHPRVVAALVVAVVVCSPTLWMGWDGVGWGWDGMEWGGVG